MKQTVFLPLLASSYTWIFSGDLAFGSPFGMVRSGRDVAPVAVSTKDAIACYDDGSSNADEVSAHREPQIASLPAVQIINARGDFSASLGVIPPILRPFVTRLIPWYSRGDQAVTALAGLAVAAVGRRLAAERQGKAPGPAVGEVVGMEGSNEKDQREIGMNDRNRTDLLARLREGKDDFGKPMGKEELTAEALTQLIAGSDTTSKCVRKPQ